MPVENRETALAYQSSPRFTTVNLFDRRLSEVTRWAYGSFPTYLFTIVTKTLFRQFAGVSQQAPRVRNGQSAQRCQTGRQRNSYFYSKQRRSWNPLQCDAVMLLRLTAQGSSGSFQLH